MAAMAQKRPQFGKYAIWDSWSLPCWKMIRQARTDFIFINFSWSKS